MSPWFRPGLTSRSHPTRKPCCHEDLWYLLTILWGTDPGTLEVYRPSLGDRVQLVESGQEVTRALAADGGELLVVVGPDIETQAACDFAAHVRVERPGVGVVAP